MLRRWALDLRLGPLWYISMLGSGALNLILVGCAQRHPLHARDYALGRRSRRACALSRYIVETSVELLIGLAGLNAVLLLDHAPTILCLILHRW
jgi:hypothetical protein